MSAKHALKWRLRDAWRVARGKPTKYTHASHQPYPVAPTAWALTEADLELLVRESQAAADSLVMVGHRDMRMTMAILATLGSVARLQVAVGPGAEPGGVAVNCPIDLGRLASDSMIRYRHVERPEQIFGSESNHSSGEGTGWRFGEGGDRPGLLIVNVDLSPDQLQQLLLLAQQAGCAAAIGWGFTTQQHRRVLAVRNLGPMHGADHLWRVQLAAESATESAWTPRVGVSKTSQPLAIRSHQESSAPGTILRFPTDRGRSEEANERVSIIVPAYRARPYLPDALEDIATQSYRNWELVVVEDGSPESVQEMVEAFAARCPEQTVIYHRLPGNLGASTARNKAMQLATGDVYAFLDADDRWLPDHLERKLGLLTRTSADVAYGTVDMFDDQSGETLFPWGPSPEELAHFPTSLMVRNFIQPSGVLVRRSLVDQVGAFDPNIFLVEDIDFWLRAVRSEKKFVYDSKITTRYRKNHASASTTGRMVLCYDGVATVVANYSHLIHDSDLRKSLVGKHLVTAGLGHLSYRPTEHNRIQPRKGCEFLRQAAALDPQLWQARRWSILAENASQAGLLSVLRYRFKRGYKQICHTPVDMSRWDVGRAA